ncbi:Tetratricopeptide repeat protein 39B [Cichlidogyrus casuarinus]|uniref:Tetratricopeptide repeat protein 39B n=1 Tax=Cichlidogyrus casuarinus TaxID=1844966 RepID=A0ABD2PI18_9PLAT
MEKFAVKRSKKYIAQKEYLAIPALEMIFLWNAFKLVKNNKPVLNYFLQTAQKISSAANDSCLDDICLANLISGVCHFYLDELDQAQALFLTILESKSDIKEDTFIVPYALVELVRICLMKGKLSDAEVILERAYSYKRYSLENRLHFKMHALKAQIEEMKNPTTKNDWWTDNPECLAEAFMLRNNLDSPEAENAVSDVQVEVQHSINRPQMMKKTRFSKIWRNLTNKPFVTSRQS